MTGNDIDLKDLDEDCDCEDRLAVILQGIRLCARVWGREEARQLWLQHPESKLPVTPRMQKMLDGIL